MKKFVCFLLVFICSNVFADPIKEMVFFGDSLTDDGNLYHTLKFIPKSPPYFEGRFSNGPTWAEDLGDYYHKKYNISILNYSIGGTTVILRNPLKGALPYTLSQEVTSYLNGHYSKDKSHTLFSIWMGSNDYMDEKQQDINALTNDVVNGLINEITRLIYNGGKNFLILDIPDISRVPTSRKADARLRARWEEIGKLSHEKLLYAINNFKKQYPDMRFIFVESYKTLNDVLDNPAKYNEKYHMHITNTEESCWLGPNTFHANYNQNDPMMKSTSLGEVTKVAQLKAQGLVPCSNPDEHVFWDGVHPTRIVHQLFAEIVKEELAKTDIV